MQRKVTSGIMIALLSVGILSLAFNIQPAKAEPKTWYVNDDGGADFTKIRDAISAASSGDTIYVYNGIYLENLYIYSKSLTIIGEGKTDTIIDGQGLSVPIIEINAQGVSVSGFTLRNGPQSWYYMWGSAVLLDYNGRSCTISDNIVLSSRYGITSYRGRNNIISGNTISDTNQGIPLYYSYNETVIGNTILNGVQYGSDPPYGIQVW